MAWRAKGSGRDNAATAARATKQVGGIHDGQHHVPSDFNALDLVSMGELFLEAGRGMWGDVLCATTADIALL